MHGLHSQVSHFFKIKTSGNSVSPVISFERDFICSFSTGRSVLSCSAMLRAAPCRASHSSAHMARQKAPDPLPGAQRDRWSK